MKLSIQEVLSFKQEIEEIKQLMIRIGLVKPPKPYNLQFERRVVHRGMNVRDCIGFNLRKEHHES